MAEERSIPHAARRERFTSISGPLVALVASLLASGCAWTARVSVATGGAQANSLSLWTALSDEGRLVAFSSVASNLLGPSGDTNGAWDVFVRDLALGTTTRVSVATGGGQANGSSDEPATSDDGRYVAFDSTAPNLVAGDTNGKMDVFVHDRQIGETTRVSVATGGGQAAGGDSFSPALSADGRYVAFESRATNLVAGDTNGAADVFVRDRVAGVTERVSVDSSEQQANPNCESGRSGISDDGRYVAFAAQACAWGPNAPGLHVWVRDRTAGTTQLIAGGSTPQNPLYHRSPDISGDGNVVAFLSDDALVPGDTNGIYDMYVYDRLLLVYERVEVSDLLGLQGDHNGSSQFFLPPAVSDDGRRVAFPSFATNLVFGDTNGVADVFVRDRVGGRTLRTSTDALLVQGNGLSAFASISGDGRYVAFVSDASTLVGGDTNVAADAFVRAANVPSVYGISPPGVSPGFSGPVTITGAGFAPGATPVNVQYLTFGSVVVVNDSTITATLTVAPNAPRPRDYDVIVANPGGVWAPLNGAAGRCTGCLVVN